MNTLGTRRALVGAVLAAASLPLAALEASATHTEPTTPNGAQVVDACHENTAGLPAGEGTCRGLEQLERDLAQLCRVPRPLVPTPEAACSAVDGRVYSAEAMAHYEASWAHEALALQARLDDTVPMRLALFPATHNSFNSAAYPPTLSGLDHNQVASLTDQLRMDMRGLELDVHWFPSPHADPGDGGRAPILCHGTTVGAVHVGCTAERHLRDGLAEIDDWLAGHPGELLVLYLENQLDGDPTAHAAAARAIEAELGRRVYRPAATCAPMPTSLSESDVLAAGKQVVVVGNCGAGGAWGTWVHERDQAGGTWDESKSGEGDDFACPAGGYAHVFKRFYEDSTWVSHTVEPTGQGSPGEITTAETTAMVACGVNLFGFDQLVPGDPRLAALVWSWAPGEPARGTAAYRDAAGRFRSDGPGHRRPYACRDAGGWHVTVAAGSWHRGDAACAAAFPGSDFAVPRTASENAALGAAGGGAEVWLGYGKARGAWRS